MSKPIFLIKIEGDPLSCLGSQLIDILKTIQPYAEKFSWYAADVEINGDRPFKLGLQGYNSHLIGDTNSLINLCNQVDQFLSGVFYQTKNKKPFEGELSSEDEEFREIPNAVLEIRAFDTTYFEVYTNNPAIVRALKMRYKQANIDSNNNNLLITHLIIPSLLMVDLERKQNTIISQKNSKYTLRTGKASKLSNSEDINKM